MGMSFWNQGFIGCLLLGLWVAFNHKTVQSSIQVYDCSISTSKDSQKLSKIPFTSSNPIVLKSCIDVPSSIRFRQWSNLWPNFSVRPNTIKYQVDDKPSGLLYFDKTRPWADYYSHLQYPAINETMSMSDFLKHFLHEKDEKDEHELETMSKYASWRLPVAIRESFRDSLLSVTDILPSTLSKELGKFDDKQSWNLWLASPKSSASPHYDIDHNIIVQLYGTKRMVLAPLSSIMSSSTWVGNGASLHPSTHPHWRHLVPQHRKYGHVLQGNLVGGETPSGDIVSSSEFKFGNESSQLLGDQAEIVDLMPGDVLYLPPFYFHATESSHREATASINIWFGDQSKQQHVEDNLRRIPLPVKNRRRPSLQSLITIISVLVNIDQYTDKSNIRCDDSSSKPFSIPTFTPTATTSADYSVSHELMRRFSTNNACHSFRIRGGTAQETDSSHVLKKVAEDQLSSELEAFIASIHETIAVECDMAKRVVMVADLIDELLEAAVSVAMRDQSRKAAAAAAAGIHHDPTEVDPLSVEIGPWEKTCAIVYEHLMETRPSCPL